MKSWGIVHIKNGQIENPAAVRKTFLELKDGRYLFEINPYNKRSSQSNRYIHGVLFPAFMEALNEAGYRIQTVDEAKEICKALFLKKTVLNEDTGEVLEFVKNTSELTKEEMSIFIEDAARWLSENLGYVLPPPNTQTKIFKDGTALTW